MIAAVDHTQVPDDLLSRSRFVRRVHEWKAAAAVHACVPFSRLLPAPKANCPGIFTYHRVVPITRDCRPSWNVTPERFRNQLSGLLRRGYSAWPLSRLVTASNNGEPIPDNVFVITFDDGYANNYLHALPILQELNVPATIFLATAYLDSDEPFPFDDWPLKGSNAVHSDSWRALTTTECHRLREHDIIEFGSHTHTHEDFRNRNNVFRSSLQKSLDVLEHTFGVTNPTLSLPYGILSEGFAGPEYFKASQELGTTCCLTTEEELIPQGASPFGWGRFLAEQTDTASTLAVKLDGWRDTARDQWRRLRGR
jgi:peptidoglycan/xylan/chitin deacetylase (PgdA/CDA1 family)